MLQFELGWKVLKELLRYEGHRIANTGSPREIIKAAYTIYDFIEEDVWLSMLRERNDLSHIYDGNAARSMASKIIGEYIPAFIRLEENIEQTYKNILDEL